MGNEKLNKLNIILKELRKQEGLTQRQVADKLGVTYQSYQAYELGIAVPSLIHFLELCNIFHVTPNDLLDY